MPDPPANQTNKTGQPKFLPTLPGNRYKLIDIVRGFALLGVVVVNWYWLGTVHFLDSDQLQNLSTVSIDQYVEFFNQFFFDDKFYTLFSILFGLGFALQLNKASAKGIDLRKTFARRLIILFFIGLIHTVFFYYGDILHIYALLGFILILFRNQSNRFILITIIALIILLALMPSVRTLLTESHKGFDSMHPSQRFEAVMNEGWIGIIKINLDLLRIDYQNCLDVLNRYLGILWRFLIGLYIGRLHLLQYANRYLPLYKQLLPLGLILGLFSNGLLLGMAYGARIYIPESAFPWSLLSIILEVGIPALSIAYLCMIVLLYQQAPWHRILDLIAPIGRMALTNYLMQSLLFVMIFYGIGLGVLGKIGAFLITLTAISVYLLQVWFSTWWLKIFRYGPAEWAWRCLTYGKWIPILKTVHE